MGIDAQLRGENGEILGEIGDPHMILARATSAQLSECRLLKYLVPYGDTMFNEAQAPDLANDIRDLRLAHAGTPLADILEDLIPLIDRLSSETHVYLWFVGD